MSKSRLGINLNTCPAKGMKNVFDRLISRPDTFKESLGGLEYRSTDITQMKTKEEILGKF